MTARGLNNIMRNLNREIKKIEGRTQLGLHRAALLIKARAIPNTPIDTGNLRASAYVESGKKLKGPYAIIGYGASYAIFVHEIDKNYTVGGWKFLENAVKESERDVINIIKEHARI